MKTPQRNFVVEFKSRRRQPRAAATSIWGDTDLNALAREVEDLSPHLFSSTAPFSDAAPAKAVEIVVTANVASGELSAARIVTPIASPEVEAPAPDVASIAATIPAPLPSDTKPASESHETPARHPRLVDKKRQRPRKAHVAALAQDKAPSVAELDVLGAENRQLKMQLAEQLQNENSRLRKMLERFAV